MAKRPDVEALAQALTEAGVTESAGIHAEAEAILEALPPGWFLMYDKPRNVQGRLDNLNGRVDDVEARLAKLERGR